MRRLLAIFACTLFIIFAGMLQTDAGWLMALFGCLAVWLLYVLDGRERRVERHKDRQSERLAILHQVLHATSDEQAPEQDDADRD